MTRYQIESEAGQLMGIYEGERRLDALAAMHRDAGYECSVVGHVITFRSADEAEICGSVDAWIITAIADSQRQRAAEAIREKACEAAIRSHERGHWRLYVRRDGDVSWSEHITGDERLIDGQARGFAAVPSVIRVGTGSVHCTCEPCSAGGEPEDSVGDDDASALEEQMLEDLARIERGYFDDEGKSQ